MAAWKTCKLGEVCVLQRGHDLPRSAMHGGIIPVVGSQGIIGYHDCPTANAPCPGVTLGRSGSLGHPRLWAEPCWIHNTALYVKDFCGNDPRFVCYLLGLINYETFNGGGAVPTLNRNVLHQLSVSLPTLSEQERIAGVLGAYDDLIAINARRMALLEEAAHRLYRECFFANPVIMRTCEAEEVCNITIGKTPSRVVQDYFTDKPPGMTWISIADMEPGMLFLSRSSEYLTADAVRRSHIQVVPTGSVLLSFKLTIGRVAIAGEPLTTNEAIAHFRLPSPIWREYVYFYLRDFNYATLGSTSAIGTAINSQIVKRMPFAVPEELARIETFHRRVSPYFDAVGVLARENALLREARDGLLPRLLREEA